MPFVPDVPWAIGKRYRLSSIAGGNENCDAGELCGSATATPRTSIRSPDVDGGGGGTNLSIDFTGATGVTGDVSVLGGGPVHRRQRLGLHRRPAKSRATRTAPRCGSSSTTGACHRRDFNGRDCVPETPENEDCMYLLGAMPTQLGELTTELPVPAQRRQLHPGDADAAGDVRDRDHRWPPRSVGIATIDADTGITVMRIREPAGGGPVTGYIVDAATEHRRWSSRSTSTWTRPT